MTTGFAYRLGARAGTWKSCDVHWANPAKGDFKKTLSYPEIELVPDNKQFIADFTIALPKPYKAGAPTDRHYKTKGIIANAVSQWVLVEIDTGAPIPKDGPWPSALIWGFLQPATIGWDEKRVKQNHGYVVDDLPRAGWFEAKADGKTKRLQVIDRSVDGKQGEARTLDLPLLSEIDAKNPHVIRYKICVTVKNNESLQELGGKVDEWKEGKRPLSGLEAGCWLKVWARNEAYGWSKPVYPKDDKDESVVEAMASEDPTYRDNPDAPHDPRTHRNHTWRRNRILAGGELAEKLGGDRSLVYVGLYPTEVINRLNEVDALMKAKGEHTVSVASMVTVLAGYGLTLYVLRNYLNKYADKVKSGATISRVEKRKVYAAAQTLLWSWRAAQVPKLATSYAVGGLYGESLALKETVERANQHEDWSAQIEETLDLFAEAMLVFDKDQKSFEEAKDRLAKRRAKLKFKRWPWKHWGTLDRSLSGEMDWEKLKLSLPLTLLEGEMKTPPDSKYMMPIAAFPLFSWGVQMKLEGELKVTPSIERDEEKNVKISAKVEGKGKIGFLMNVQATHTAAAEKAIGQSSVAIGAFSKKLKSLAEVTDIQLSLDASATLSGMGSVELEIPADNPQKPDAISSAKASHAGKKEGSSCKRTFKFNLDAEIPARFQLSVFQWTYPVANGEIAQVSPNQLQLARDFSVLGKRIEGRVWTWGKNQFDPFLEMENANSLFLGQDFRFRLLYENLDGAEHCKASLSFKQGMALTHVLAKKGIETGTSVTLSDKLKTTDKKDLKQVLCESRLAWNPGPLPLGRASLLETLVGDNGDSVIDTFYGSLLKKGVLDLVPTLTLPDDTERSIKGDGFQLLCPQFKTLGATVRTLGKKALLWRIEAQHYLDQYLWVRIRHGGLVQDLIKGDKPGEGPVLTRGDWHLINLLGQATRAPWPFTIILPLDSMPHFTSGDTGAWKLDLSLGPTEAGTVLSVNL